MITDDGLRNLRIFEEGTKMITPQVPPLEQTNTLITPQNLTVLSGIVNEAQTKMLQTIHGYLTFPKNPRAKT